MVRLEKNKLIIEIETDDPGEKLVIIRTAIQKLIITSMANDEGSPYAIDAAFLLTEIELTPDQAKKLIEPATSINQKHSLKN